MKEKKNIERLFQESFKDFEVTPHEKNWEHIQNKLNKKENDRKPVPAWFKYAGVAAILLLFLAIFGGSFLNGNDIAVPDNNVVTETENPINNDSSSEFKTGVPTTDLENENSSLSSVASDSGTLDSEKTSTTPNSNNTLFDSSPQNLNNTLVSNNNSSQVNSKEEINSNSSFAQQNNNNINVQNSEKDSSIDDQSTKPNNKNIPNSINTNDTQVVLNTNQRNNHEVSDDNNVKDLQNETNKNSLADSNSIEESSKESLNIEEDQDIAKLNEIQKDSLSIEDAIAKSEEKEKDEKEKLVNRWQVFANIAPVYYNTLGEGSHLHEQFVKNPKNGEVNTSYGINVGYALNDRFTLRTGVNSLKLSYDTANVVLYETTGSTQNPDMQLRNIDFADNGSSNISVISADNIVAQQLSFIDPSFNAAISQRISYYEVPVEMGYNVINKKVNLQVIGGFSTFFLDDNEVYTEFEGRKSYIGKANNIENVSFSANLGLGLDYNFSQKFKFNLEPTFKYQLNAYSETSGNFRPYIIGVYTGFSYKF